MDKAVKTINNEGSFIVDSVYVGKFIPLDGIALLK